MLYCLLGPTATVVEVADRLGPPRIFVTTSHLAFRRLLSNPAIMFPYIQIGYVLIEQRKLAITKDLGPIRDKPRTVGTDGISCPVGRRGRG